MLKNARLAAVGDVIRGYDFNPMADRGDSYVEGIVVDKGDVGSGYDAYAIRVTKDVFGGEVMPKGEHSRVGKIVYVPFEVDFLEYDGRVMNLSK